jgi:hypothetical protein
LAKILVIVFEVSLINWLQDGKENKDFKNKMEVVMTLEFVSNTEGTWRNMWHSKEEYE